MNLPPPELQDVLPNAVWHWPLLHQQVPRPAAPQRDWRILQGREYDFRARCVGTISKVLKVVPSLPEICWCRLWSSSIMSTLHSSASNFQVLLRSFPTITQPSLQVKLRHTTSKHKQGKVIKVSETKKAQYIHNVSRALQEHPTQRDRLPTRQREPKVGAKSCWLN